MLTDVDVVLLLSAMSLNAICFSTIRELGGRVSEQATVVENRTCLLLFDGIYINFIVWVIIGSWTAKPSELYFYGHLINHENREYELFIGTLCQAFLKILDWLFIYARLLLVLRVTFFFIMIVLHFRFHFFLRHKFEVSNSLRTMSS